MQHSSQENTSPLNTDCLSVLQDSNKHNQNYPHSDSKKMNTKAQSSQQTLNGQIGSSTATVLLANQKGKPKVTFEPPKTVPEAEHLEKVARLSKQLQNNRQYTEKLEHKYTILLESVEPFEEKVSLQKVIKKVQTLENQVEQLKAQQAELLSEQEKTEQLLRNSVKTNEINDNSDICSDDTLSISNRSRASSMIGSETRIAERQKDRKKSEGFQLQSFAGFSGESLQASNYTIQKSTIENFVTVEEIKKDLVHFNRKRKNSESQEHESKVWEKTVKDHLSSSGSETFKSKTLAMIAKKTVPLELRSMVWPMVFQNRLGITPTLYMELLQRLQKGWIEQAVQLQIEKDIARSFTGKGTELEKKEKLAEDIREVLELFHLYRPDISYVQGMTYPAIVLTTVVGKMQAFCILCNTLVCVPFFKRLYTFEKDYPSIYCRTFDLLLKDTNPSVYQLLRKRQIHSEIYLIEWFYTFFSRGITFETILKVWDHITYFEEITIFRMALAVIDSVQEFLAQAHHDEMISLIKEFSSYVDQNKLIEAFMAVSAKISEEKYKKAYKKAFRNFYS